MSSLIALCYLVGLLIGNAVAMPLGALINALTGVIFLVPHLGSALAIVLNRRVKITVLFKLFAWCVSSLGMVIAYAILTRLIGPPRDDLQWLAVAVAAAIVVMNLSYRILMFEPLYIPTLDDVEPLMPSSLTAFVRGLGPQESAALIRANFANLNVTAILQLLSTAGLLLFALARLQVVLVQAGAQLPTLIECQLTTFSLLSIASGEAVPFVGAAWLILRFTLGVVLLVWIAAFVSFAIEWLPKHSPDTGDTLSLENRLEIERIVAEAIAAARDAEMKKPAPPSDAIRSTIDDPVK